MKSNLIKLFKGMTFVNLIKLVNQILPVDNSNEIDENIEIYDLINAEIALFNNEQTLLLQRLFSVLIIYSKQFLYIDLLIYVIELINKFGIEISDDIENDINETEIVFEIVNTTFKFTHAINLLILL